MSKEITEPSPRPEPSGCCATALRKASRRITQLYDDALESSGLRSTQYAILAELHRQPKPPTLAVLAEALVMDRSAMGHNLRPLEREKWVALRASDTDGRRRHVVLTAAGKAKYAEARKHWKRAQDRLYEVFGEAEAERLRTTLLTLAHDERLAALKG